MHLLTISAVGNSSSEYLEVSFSLTQKIQRRVDSKTHGVERHYVQSLILTFTRGILIFYMTARFLLLHWVQTHTCTPSTCHINHHH